MRNGTPNNATLYQDTPFENIPHIRLGVPIGPDHALYYDLVVNPPLDNVQVSELGQGWHGTLIRFSEEDWEEYESCNVFHDRRFAGGVVWQLSGNDDMAVHLLTDEFLFAIAPQTASSR